MILSLALGALLAQAGYYSPQEAQGLFSQANEAYSREDYAAAVAGYGKLLDHGYGGADVLYNLGTAYLAQGDVGNAVLSFERARRLDGRRADIEANLALARSRQLDQVVGAQVEEAFLPRLVAATSEPLVGWTFLAAWAAGFCFLILFRFLSPGRRTWAAVLSAFCLCGAVPAGLLLGAHAYQRETVREAVVLVKTAQARELPRDAGKVSFEVHAGLKVRILEDAGEFVHIRLPNGLEGWTERTAVAEI